MLQNNTLGADQALPTRGSYESASTEVPHTAWNSHRRILDEIPSLSRAM